MEFREERDALGKKSVPSNAYYGIGALRSFEIFPSFDEKINPRLIKAYLEVKKAAAETNYKTGLLFKEKYDAIEEAIEKLIIETENAIERKSFEIYEKIIVSPYQGGAGASLNTNINEVIANTALEILGEKFGEYSVVHPYDDVNMSQSTNDTFLTAFAIAAIRLLRELSSSQALLSNSLLEKAKEFQFIPKLGRTQYQDSTPLTLGQEFEAFAAAIERDRWRMVESEKSLLKTPIGGGAIGNSIGISKNYFDHILSAIKKISKLPLERESNLIDQSKNLDRFEEVLGALRIAAGNLLKMAQDLMFLSSGPNGGIGEIILPALLPTSSTMPGKINPAALEFAVQICSYSLGISNSISSLLNAGALQNNPYLPLISHLFFKNIEFLHETYILLSEYCIKGIKANVENCRAHLLNSMALAPALVPALGYDTVQEICSYAAENKITFLQALIKSKVISEMELYNLIYKELKIDISEKGSSF